MIPQPTIKELIDAAARAVRGLGDRTADFVRGSDYEAFAGSGAVIWSRQAMRDTDMFNAVNFHTADGNDLTNLVYKRFGKRRILDSRGTGTAVATRAAAGSDETFYKGTRIAIPGVKERYYRLKENVSVAGSDLTAELPIEAVELGPGQAIEFVQSGIAKFADALNDVWTVASVHCSDGTAYEKASDFRARVLRERLDERTGFEAAIIAACKRRGASNVAIFRSDYAGDAYDNGLNVVYVGDLGYSATPELVKACSLELESVRVGGDHLQVLPMARLELDVTADVYLYDSPVKFDTARLKRSNSAAIVQYLNGKAGRFAYSLDGIRGAISRSTEVQRVELVLPLTEDSIVSGSRKNFPATLNRYVPGQIVLRYHGP